MKMNQKKTLIYPQDSTKMIKLHILIEVVSTNFTILRFVSLVFILITGKELPAYNSIPTFNCVGSFINSPLCTADLIIFK